MNKRSRRRSRKDNPWKAGVKRTKMPVTINYTILTAYTMHGAGISVSCDCTNICKATNVELDRQCDDDPLVVFRPPTQGPGAHAPGLNASSLRLCPSGAQVHMRLGSTRPRRVYVLLEPRCTSTWTFPL